MLEKEIEAKVCQYARSLGFDAMKQEWPGTHGAPDRLFITPQGRIFMIEFKSAKGKLSGHQDRRIKRLLKMNVDIYVINSVETGIFLLDTYYVKPE